HDRLGGALEKVGGTGRGLQDRHRALQPAHEMGQLDLIDGIEAQRGEARASDGQLAGRRTWGNEAFEDDVLFALGLDANSPAAKDRGEEQTQLAGAAGSQLGAVGPPNGSGVADVPQTGAATWERIDPGVLARSLVLRGPGNDRTPAAALQQRGRIERLAAVT